MSSQLQVTGEAKIRDIQGPVVANSGVITALDGAASQYVRGDGTLADFPTSSGGGSSVSYYLNSSVSQGTIGGVAYRELSKEPIIGAGTDIAISSNGYVASYLTDANDPDVILIPGGNFNCEFYFSVNNNTGNPFFYAELYKYDGTTFTLLGSSVGVPEYITQGTTIAPYYFAIPVATATLALTDRLAIRIYVNVGGRTVTLHTENGHLCQVVTTLSKGMVSLNNLTDQSQYLTTGTSGTNFAIVSSGDTHTFNLPIASATNTGKLSSTDWSTFNNKVPYTGATSNVDLGTNDLIAGGISSSGIIVANGLLGALGGLDFQKGNTPSSFTLGDVILYAEASSNNIVFRDNTSKAKLVFDNSTQTYTFPASSGTIALTSNLSAYLPLTGGILTGTTRMDGSGGTTDSITMVFNSGINRLLAPVLRLYGATSPSSNYVELFGSLATQNRTINFPDASGTVALTSDLHSPVTIGTANGLSLSGQVLSLALSSTSTTGALSSTDWNTFNNKASTASLANYLPLAGGTLTGALSGTSAVFSSSVSASSLDASQIINKQAGTSPSFALIRNVSGYATWLGIDGNNDFNIFDNDATSLAFSVRLNANRGQITTPFYGGSGNVIIGANNSGTLTKMVIGSGLSFDGTTLTASGSISSVSGTSPISVTTVSGAATVSIATASASVTGALTSTNWNTFNNKIGGSGTAGYIPVFTASGTIGNSSIQEGEGSVSINNYLFSGLPYFSYDTSLAASFRITSNTNGNQVRLAFGTVSGVNNYSNIITTIVDNSADTKGRLDFQVRNGNNSFATPLTLAHTGAATFSSSVDATIANLSSGLKVTGSSLTSGTGAEIVYSSGKGIFLTFNRSAGTYLPTEIDGSTVTLSTSGTPRLTIASTGAATFSGALTMNAYSFASSAIQFTRANTNTVAPGSGNGILVFSGGNAQMRMDTSNGINFDMFNSGGTTHTALKIQQNGNTVVVNSPDNSLPLAIAYQGTIHGYMGAASSALYAYSNNGGYVLLNASSVWVAASDAKRKRNFETYSLGLDAILGLQPKLYNMDFQEDGDEKQVGLVAQEVKEHIPQAFEQSEDFIGINYNVIIVTLVNAIQELKAEIDILKNK
jgi:hypothetical protein